MGKVDHLGTHSGWPEHLLPCRLPCDVDVEQPLGGIAPAMKVAQRHVTTTAQLHIVEPLVVDFLKGDSAGSLDSAQQPEVFVQLRRRVFTAN